MLDKFLPPTDNLYKFIAIAGLMLIVLAFIPNYFKFKLIESGIEEAKDIRILNIEMESLIAKQKRIQQEFNELKESKIKNQESISNDYLDKTINGILQDQEKNKDVQIKLEEIRAHNELLTFYESSLSATTILSIIMITLGVLLAGAGFSLWYKNFQKPNDEILKQQVKELKLSKIEETKDTEPEI